MSDTIKNRIDKIRAVFTEEELRMIFTKRIDEGLFKSIGYQAEGVPHLAVWKGYEMLCGVGE